MPEPSFFLVGAPKCGTTALDNYLAQHPSIFMGRKESYHFARDLIPEHDRFYAREDYQALFKNAGNNQLVGESSVFYLLSTSAAEAIKHYQPEARIIVMLREPAALLYSMHSENVFNGFENLSFEAALQAEQQRRQYFTKLKDPPRIYQRLFYSELVDFQSQIARFEKHFPREQMHFILYDDFKANTKNCYQQTLNFLGIQMPFTPDFKIINSNKSPRSKLLSRLLRHTPARIEKIRRRLGIPRSFQSAIHQKLQQLNRKEAPRAPLDESLRIELNRQHQSTIDYLEELLERPLPHYTQPSD